MAACESPNCLHSSIWRSISFLICVTMAAACPVSADARCTSRVDVRQQRRLSLSLCSQRVRWLWQSEPVPVSKVQTGDEASVYQIKVVLYHIGLECLRRERAISHPLHELVVRVLVPCYLDILSLKHVIHEAASATRQRGERHNTACISLRRERRYLHGVEVVQWTGAFAQIDAHFDARFDIPARRSYSVRDSGSVS